MTRFVSLALFAALAVGPAGAAPRLAPPNPYTDKGACPFECCTYRDWKTIEPVVLLDKPDGKKKIAGVPAGIAVRGLTGEVISTPVGVIAKQAYQGSPIHIGNSFYLLHRQGEGFWLVWFKEKTYSVELDPGSSIEGPPSDGSWWVNIRLPDRKSGWVLENGQFSNMDACG